MSGGSHLNIIHWFTRICWYEENRVATM